MLTLCVSVLVLDIIAAGLPRVAEPGEVVIPSGGIEIHVGGHAANISINLRRLGLKEGDVGVIGAVGDDLPAHFIDSELRNYGVITYLQRASGPTGKNVILVVKGQDRRFHSEIPPSPTPSHVVSILRKERPRIFYVGTTGIMKQIDNALEDILKEAKGMGCITFVDPVVPPDNDWSYLRGALKWTDIFHSNDVEAIHFTGEADPESALETIMKMGVSLGIVSMGERGLLAANKRIWISLPSFKVNAIDPTGAGDALAAGIIHGLLRFDVSRPVKVAELTQTALLDILIYAEAVGAACVMRVGTTSGVTPRRVNRLMESQAAKIRELASIRMIK
jgi:ribokinase